MMQEQGAYFEGKSRRLEKPLSTSETTAADSATTKAQPVVHGREKHKNRPEAAFLRSIPDAEPKETDRSDNS
jgi:hypothetical protein